MKYLYVVLLNLLLANIAFADRYGMYEDADSYGGGSGIVGTLGILIITVLAYWYLHSTFQDWKDRRKSKEKELTFDFSWDTLFMIGFLSIIGIFIAFPVIMMFKFFGGVDAVDDVWATIWIISTSLVVFLSYN